MRSAFSSCVRIAKHLHQPLPQEAQLDVLLPPGAYAAIAYLMQKNPANRPESWAEVAELLKNIGKLPGCPKCGNAMAEDDVICVECGFNRKAGVQLVTNIGGSSASGSRRPTSQPGPPAPPPPKPGTVRLKRRHSRRRKRR